MGDIGGYMDTQIVLQQDIDTSIEQKIDPVELATVVYPRIQFALEQAKTPGEVSTIRSQINAVQEYIKKELPKVVKDRLERFNTTFDGDKLYCEASAKLGAMWEAVVNKWPKGKRQDIASSDDRRMMVSWEGYFPNDRDATRCVRASMLDEEDRRVYFEEMYEKVTQPTVSGLERWWIKLQGSDDLPPLEGHYRVIYADPPWEYGNTMPDYFHEQRDHYKLLTAKEIAAMPVKDIAEDNAVLFLWVTSPILEEGFEVIKAWGFEYKASFVWDKVKHNMGHYNSVRHEFLLVCTRGSCTPETLKLYDSVVSIERTEHSVKPAEFRQMIDSLYPSGNRIELFARESVDGWDIYGNESGVS